jgi:hypothetical protein
MSPSSWSHPVPRWVHRGRAVAAASLTFATLWFAACSKQAPLSLGENQRPTLELTQAPVSSTQPFFYAYELRWAGYDVDGHIAYFRYSIDPPTTPDADTVWTKTSENRKSFLFHSDKVDTTTDKTAEGYHTIVLEAVDDRGAVSAPEACSFTSFTIAPTIQITNPVPNHLLPPTFGPSFHVSWAGNDPDGRGTNKPVKYKFKVFSSGSQEFDFLTLLVNPDSLRRRYAPTFSVWDSVGGDTLGIDIHNLVPGQDYVLAIVAFDEVGAYSPVMNFDNNLLFFHVSYAGLLGPKLTVFNESFFYTAPSGGFSLDPTTFVHTESPAGRAAHFGWFANTTGGTFVSGYRWMMDGNVGDERPRGSEDTDLNRWSRYSAQTLGVDLPPFNPSGVSETHFLYIEAEDNNSQVSLVVVQFTVVRALFDRDLLFVDDTRFSGDRPVVGGCVDRPRGVWPATAELDTYFFARGGKTWRCYPAGSLSPTGIFQGYSFDTLGTRFLPQGTLTLQQLSHYRHVVWYTDFKGSLNINDPFLTQDPMSELRWLTLPGRSNPLGTWVSQGGELWMFGGGCASALQRNFEKSGTAADVYSAADGELGPGRFMYDVFGWQSEISSKSYAQAQKPFHSISRTADSLDYSQLPDYLFEKSTGTDPMSVYAPSRTSPSDFYQTSLLGEGLTKPNEVLIDVGADPSGVHQVSVLDTLYESVGGQLGSSRPVMTIDHGPTGQRQVFSGFPLWYWRRDEQIAIGDFVLQKVWGISRQPVPR